MLRKTTASVRIFELKKSYGRIGLKNLTDDPLRKPIVMEHLSLGYALFALTSVASIGYTLLAKRRLDLFTLASLSGFLFSLTLFSGFLEGPRTYAIRPVEPELYYSFALFFTFLLFGALANDRWGQQERQPNRAPLHSHLAVRLTTVALWGTLFLAVLYQHGFDVFYGVSKLEIINRASEVYTLHLYAALLAVVTLILSRSLPSYLIAAVIVLITLLIGHRSILVLGALAVLIAHGSGLPTRSLLRAHPVLLPCLVAAGLVLVALLKPAYSQFKVGGVESVVTQFQTTKFEDLFTTGAEFLYTQYQFNEIVRTDFATDGGHILRSPLSLTPIPRSLYTTPSSEFNDLFQPVLFPDIASGMAYNPFAEFYAASGMLGVGIFCFCYAALLLAFNQLILGGRSAMFLPLLAIVGSLVTFYLFRNSMSVTFGFLRNTIWPYLFCWATASLLAGRVLWQGGVQLPARRPRQRRAPAGFSTSVFSSRGGPLRRVRG